MYRYKIKKLSITSFIILIVIIINENLLYLVNRPLAPIIAGFAILTFIIRFKTIIEKHYLFKKEILSLIFISFISEIGAMYQYGQPILYGLYGMHYIFIYFIYFYFVDYFNTQNNKNNQNLRESVKKIIINLGTIMSFLYFVQALIYPKMIIFNMSYGERGGHVRFYTGYILIMFSIIFTYSKLLTKFNAINSIKLLVQTSSLIIVSQTRNYILAIFLVLICGMFIKKKNNKIIIIIICLLLFPIVYWLFLSNSNNLINNLINSLVIESELKNGTVGIRMREINYYMNMLRKNLVSGMGILYSRFYLTNDIVGFNNYWYYVGDIGMIGFVAQTGLLGAIWFVTFLISLYKKCKKSDEESSYLLKLTLILILALMGTTGILIAKESILYLSVVFAITEFVPNN